MPLTLLRDAASVPAFVRWVEESAEEGPAFEALLALDRIGSPDAVETLLACSERARSPRHCLTVFAKLESPANLALFAARCARRPATRSDPFWEAFLILLGRRS